MKVNLVCEAVEYKGRLTDEIDSFFSKRARIKGDILCYYQDGIEHFAVPGNWVVKVNSKYIVVNKEIVKHGK